MIEKYYTPEQLEQLRRRERDLGGEAIEQAQRDWSELIAAVKSEREQGNRSHQPPDAGSRPTLAGADRAVHRRRRRHSRLAAEHV